MAALMSRFAPVLLALLAACRQTSPSGAGDPTIANAAGPRSSEMAASLQNKGVGNPTSTAAGGSSPSSPEPSTAGVNAPLSIDTNRQREYADVYVDMKDPGGQKGLVSYLMKPDEWHIEKVVQINPTLKHWRFWRVSRTDGKSMPEVDPLRPRR